MEALQNCFVFQDIAKVKKKKNIKTWYNYNVLQNIVLWGNYWKTFRLWILSPVVGIWPHHLIHITGNVLPCQAMGENISLHAISKPVRTSPHVAACLFHGLWKRHVADGHKLSSAMLKRTFQVDSKMGCVVAS